MRSLISEVYLDCYSYWIVDSPFFICEEDSCRAICLLGLVLQLPNSEWINNRINLNISLSLLFKFLVKSSSCRSMKTLFQPFDSRSMHQIVTLRDCHAWLTKKIFSKRTIRRDITLVLKGEIPIFISFWRIKS